MKKLLSIITSLFLVGVSAGTVVSCSRPLGAGNIDGNSALNEAYKTQYNYQTGPAPESIDLNDNLHDSLLVSFNGSAESSYSAYNVDSGIYNPTFFGNKDQLVKTSDKNFSPSGWLNDTINFQNILYFKKDLKDYTNINLSVSDNTKTTEDKKLVGKINFEKYMLTQPGETSQLVDSISPKRQYVPDAVGTNHMDTLSQKVSDDGYYDGAKGAKIPRDVYFDVWNSWISLQSNSSTLVGNHKITINISFDYKGKLKSYKKQTSVNIKNLVLNKSGIDENNDGKIDSGDRFGLSAATFPVNGLSQWKNDVFNDQLKNIDVAAKMGVTSWTSKLDDAWDPMKVNIKTLYLSNGSNLSYQIGKDGVVSFYTTTPNLNFDAFLEVVDTKNAVLGSYSVYYNEFGTPTYKFIYNDKKDGIVNKINGKDVVVKDPTKIVDINGDGKKDTKDWDIDGDGQYTREDYDASGSGSKDEIGPNPNYADYVRRTPKAWWELDNSYDSLEKSNSLFISGTGTHKQLIQYTGKLSDDVLGKMAKFNGNSSGYADQYEQALGEANENASKFASFMDNRKGHQWNWTFDFTNLDLYMRLAAGKNIPSVMINPVDVGGFSFWYLKGENAKLGPQRDMLKKSSLSLIDNNTGKISATGSVYLRDVIAPLAKQLSTHLANDINTNDAYKLPNGQPVKLYFSFDEDNEKCIDDTMKVVDNNSVSGGKIYSSCFLGWRSNVYSDRFNSASKAWQADLTDQYIDQIIFVSKCINDNNDLISARDLIKRRSIDYPWKTLMMYTTWYAYPGGYCQSDLSGSYWQMFFGYKLGMNGYARWAYDDVYSDYYDSSVIDYAKKLPHTSGQSFFTYGGSDSTGAYYSTRLLAWGDAINYIYKIKEILNSGNEANISKVAQGLQSIGLSKAIYSNNDYKWNANNNVSMDDFQMPSENYGVSVSEQVHRLVNLINSLD